jgi:glycosyltransferase involved in cell wall biosynthesis
MYMHDVPLRIVLPIVTYVPGGMGGSETYLRELIGELGRRGGLVVHTVVSRAASGTLEGAEEVVASRIAGGGRTGERLRTLAQALWLTPPARRLLEKADVVHYPLTVPVPTVKRAWVHTLLDVQHLDLPDMFSPAERLYRAVAYDRAARHAGRVITISEFSKGRIVERLGVEPDRVVVAHLGVNAQDFAAYTGPREPYVYYPAAAWPHKNHRRLIEAVEILRRDQPDFRLVLTGAKRELLGHLPDWVEHRGFVSRDEVRRLYRSAGCMAFPSMYEGFGLPPLEAMASGCPVAAARAGSLPEICGDAATMFDPLDPVDIARAIRNVQSPSPSRIDIGLAQARRFTWSRCAETHVATYAEMSSNPRGGRTRPAV